MWLSIVRGKSSVEIAHELFMCEKSVHRYLSLFHASGSVSSKAHCSGPDRMLGEFEQFTVLQTLIHHPTAYLHEVQTDLFEATGVWASSSTICRTIKYQNFTHKKVQRVALRGVRKKE